MADKVLKLDGLSEVSAEGEARKVTNIVVRELSGASDADVAGRISKKAFNQAQLPVFGRMLSCADEEKTCAFYRAMTSHPKIYKVVACIAESGQVIGSNFMEQRDQVAGIGPLSVDPDAQASGAGRALMQAAIAKALKDGHESIRLQQEAFNLVSFALYAKLGFEPKDQLSIFMGRCTGSWPEPHLLNLDIRPMTANDLPHCNALHQAVVGVSREHALADCLSPQWAAAHDTPLVAVDQNDGRIVGYSTGVTGFSHGVYTCDEVLARLHFEMTQRTAAGRRDDDVLLKLFGRLNPELVKWALTHGGLRLQRQATVMVLGSYADPCGGVYVPTMLY